jgi:ATP-dependent Lhr-like helicase
VGALDPAAIEQVAADAWPAVRDPDELHDGLLTLITAPPDPAWMPHFDPLVRERRATTLVTPNARFWVPAEQLLIAQAAHPGARIEPQIPAVPLRNGDELTPESASTAIVRGWLESSGPITPEALVSRLDLPQYNVDQALAALEAEGQILRGRFTPGLPEGQIEWCNRRLLARIHRLTLGTLRREIEPVTTADFMRFLARWQHVAPGTQLHGADGLFQVLKQLQGYELPAASWESQVLPKRIARYSPEFLDRLCLSGEVMWGRLSPHPAFERLDARRVRPTRVAPVTIFLREDAGWLLADANGSGERPVLSHPATDVLAEIDRRGALFFPEIVRASKRLPSEVEDALWELVAAGLVTADGFENLRALVDPKRRRGEGRGRSARPRHAAGRWARLQVAEPAASAEDTARQLLRRWGVVFRDITARETLTLSWRDLLVAFRRMEARGEIRGGRFVAGFLGEQFALPEAIDVLRSIRRSEKSGEEIVVTPADPLNLLGILLPGQRLSALSGGVLRLRDGVALETEQAGYVA